MQGLDEKQLGIFSTFFCKQPIPFLSAIVVRKPGTYYHTATKVVLKLFLCQIFTVSSFKSKSIDYLLHTSEKEKKQFKKNLI